MVEWRMSDGVDRGRCGVDPCVAAIGIDEGEAGIDEDLCADLRGRHRRGSSCLQRECGHSRPRRSGAAYRSWAESAWPGGGRRLHRRALESDSGSNRSPRTGSAPRARMAASFASPRERARTVYPEASSCGMVARPRTPVAPVTKHGCHCDLLSVDEIDDVNALVFRWDRALDKAEATGPSLSGLTTM